MYSKDIAGRADVAARMTATALGLGFVTAVVAMPMILISGVARVGFGETQLQVDGLAVVMSVLVLGLSALIQSFAVRYLRGDPRQIWFVGTATLLTGLTVVMVCAGSVAVFAVAWIGAGGALVLLLATYSPRSQARQGVRATAVRFVIADAAFLVALGLLLASAGGDVSWQRLGTVIETLPLQVQLLVAGLLVTAALARSAQIPFHGWLPFTLAAPTPVSALMHAGVVNAGAILLFRFAPAITAHPAIMTVVFLAGASTLVYAAALRLVRADVKGRLVFSTMGQMGFMIMTCGLGLFAAAIFHLVAHSLFKSALFLSAGTGISEHAVTRDLPIPRSHTRATVAVAVSLAVVVPAIALLVAKLVFSPTVSLATMGLLAFVYITAAMALASALTTNFSARTVAAGVTAIVALSIGYVSFLEIFSGAIESALPTAAASAWLLAVPVVGLAAVQLLARNPRWLAGLRDLLFTRSVTATVSSVPSARGVL